MFFRCVKILLTYWSKFKFGIIFKHWFDEKKRLSNLALLYAFLSKILKNGPDNATVQKVITRALPAITYIHIQDFISCLFCFKGWNIFSERPMPWLSDWNLAKKESLRRWPAMLLWLWGLPFRKKNLLQLLAWKKVIYFIFILFFWEEAILSQQILAWLNPKTKQTKIAVTKI